MPGQIELTLVLRQPEAANDISERLLAGTFDRATFNAADLAASPSDVNAVVTFAASHNLEVVKSDPTARSIKVSGSAAEVGKAFDIPAESVAALNYKGLIVLPAPLDQIVMAVLGLDHSPIARSHTQ